MPRYCRDRPLFCTVLSTNTGSLSDWFSNAKSDRNGEERSGFLVTTSVFSSRKFLLKIAQPSHSHELNACRGFWLKYWLLAARSNAWLMSLLAFLAFTSYREKLSGLQRLWNLHFETTKYSKIIALGIYFGTILWAPFKLKVSTSKQYALRAHQVVKVIVPAMKEIHCIRTCSETWSYGTVANHT